MKLISLILCLSLLLGLVACGKQDVPTLAESKSMVNLLSTVKGSEPVSKAADEAFRLCANDLAVSLLQGDWGEGENRLIAPYSILVTLAMVANGAQGETLAQIQDLTGLSVEDMNSYLSAMEGSHGQELCSSNSLWVKEDYAIKDSFLQSLADRYDAGVYSAPFTESTLQAINKWVEESTAGKITEALGEMDPNATLYLLNCLSFDAKWEHIYEENNIHKGSFHGAQGEQTVDFLFSEEVVYLEDENTTGFLKDYAGNRYSFVALLPNEGMGLEDYVASLTGESLTRLMENAQNTTVITETPKFTVESNLDLSGILSDLGMTEAFTMEADFSGIEDRKELYISNFLHKTSLTLDEAGTQAGAATVVEFATKGVLLSPRTVILDRPFVMGIYDKTNACFLFLGTVENPN